MQPNPAAIPETRLGHLLDAYAVLLLDAYGVLVDLDGALPGAARLVDTLNARRQDYFLVSNSASKLDVTAARQYARFGLAIPPERIISAGGLLVPYFREHGLGGARCAVLGTGDSLRLALTAGAEPVHDAAIRDGAEFEVLIVADQAFEPFWERFDAALGALFRRLDRGDAVRLILPNPDLIYPRAGGFGFTSGSLALMLEAVLDRRYPERAPFRFEALGKPHARIFAEAERRAGGRTRIMIGDQLETDILGACRSGIDSALRLGGVSRDTCLDGVRPTYILTSLDL
jgi:HAD superfamily hydrolase (TIGR01450 family)